MKTLHLVNQYADVSDSLHRHTVYCDSLSEYFDSVSLHFSGPVRFEKLPSNISVSTYTAFSSFRYRILFRPFRILGWIEFFFKVLFSLFFQINFKTPRSSKVCVYCSHVQPFCLLIPFFLKIFCPFARIVSIVELRDLWPESIAPIVPFSRSSSAYHFFLKYFNTCFRFSDRVVFLAPKALEYYSMFPDKTVILPNPLPCSPALTQLEIQTRKQSISFCYSGAMNEINNIDFMITSLSEFCHKLSILDIPSDLPIIFHFVGGGRLSSLLEEFIHKQALNKCCKFVYHGIKPKAYALGLERVCHYSLAPIRPQPVHYYGNSQNKIVSACFSRSHIIYTGVIGTGSLIDCYPYKSTCLMSTDALSGLLISKCVSSLSQDDDFANGIGDWSPPSSFSSSAQMSCLTESLREFL